MITIQSHPTPPNHPQSLFNHLNRPWIDLSDLQWPPMKSNDLQWLTDWLLSANRIQLCGRVPLLMIYPGHHFILHNCNVSGTSCLLNHNQPNLSPCSGASCLFNNFVCPRLWPKVVFFLQDAGHGGQRAVAAGWGMWACTILIVMLVRTSFCGEVGFGIWLKHQEKI